MRKRWALLGGFVIAVLALIIGGKSGVVPACTMFGSVALAYMGSTAYQAKGKE